ncbi:hypothetical protein CERZMDRAFT_65782 [Cercospora zeae-maydis SCOH1-5]|uniref:Prenyltransferase alpha-alpha toroid domain-containing protein n=1 Tax=Cercospora zeae-maydis SCOH1-5 TaxID=717836 RepID=A0A6A6FPX3_9PEZI|nr:hypothetical protein CERZMDRAFT_65782 [Cercospora zeae-maydis SCOH1-5]
MVELRETDAEDTLDETIKDLRVEEVPSDDDDSDYEDVESDGIDGVPFPGKPFLKPAKPTHLPPWLLHREIFNLIPDDLQTTTSKAQEKTEAECLALLTGDESLGLPLNSHGIPQLNRIKHAHFLRDWLSELPAPYVAMDASRPWVFYWVMAGLSFMGNDVTNYKHRLMETVTPLQNRSGGFGGGHGQLSHCAATYATLLALAAVGGLEVVDRKAMWHFLGQVKQSDGGFRMALDAEEDIRGAYCAMTAITLLNLPLELPPDAPARKAGLTSFLDNLGDWIGRCQTYEGGIAGAPTNEAHGAYAFCALACLSILDAPHISIPRYLNMPSLLSWLAGIQTSPEGGFAGRTNKLVDACYSHWVGSCWSLIQAAIAGPTYTASKQIDIWSRAGQIRYLLCCGQQPGKRGGMRDKPSTRPDAYHTCYSLAGLSAAMNHYQYDVKGETVDESGRLGAAFQWKAEGPSKEEMQAWAVDEADLVVPVHPVFVLPMDVVEKSRVQFEKGGF